MANEHIVIAGGGLAGATAAKTLRAEGYGGGDVTVVGAEQRTPYIRPPPLSKEFLLGKADADSARSTRGLVRGERRRASSWQPRQPDLP